MQNIGKIRKSPSITQIAVEYSIGKFTVCDIRKKADNILAFCSETECGLSKRKTLKSSENPKVERALYAWFL